MYTYAVKPFLNSLNNSLDYYRLNQPKLLFAAKKKADPNGGSGSAYVALINTFPPEPNHQIGFVLRPQDSTHWELACIGSKKLPPETLDTKAKKQKPVLISMQDIVGDSNKRTHWFPNRVAPPKFVLQNYLKMAQETCQASKTEIPVIDEKNYSVVLNKDQLVAFFGTGIAAMKAAKVPLFNIADEKQAMLSCTSNFNMGLGRYEWHVGVGNSPLTKAEIDALAALPVPVVQVGGNWVKLNPKGLKVLKMLLGGKIQPTTEEMVLIASTGIIPGRIRALLNGDMEGIRFDRSKVDINKKTTFQLLKQTPEGFMKTLDPEQLKGVSWLLMMQEQGLGAILADDMGFGKTAQLLGTILTYKERNPNDKRPVLVVCPSGLIGNWQDEIKKFTLGLKVAVPKSMQPAQRDAFRKSMAGTDVVLTNYEQLPSNLDIYGQGISGTQPKWAMVILDESQKMKNWDVNLNKALREIHGTHRIAATGTPIENHLKDLIPVLHFLNPTLFHEKTIEDIKKRFIYPIHRAIKTGDRDSLEEHQQKFGEFLKPFVLRRDKSSLNLPSLHEPPAQTYPLTSEQTRLAKEIITPIRALLVQIKNTTDNELKKTYIKQLSALLFPSLGKLKLILNHPDLYNTPANKISLANFEKRSPKANVLLQSLQNVYQQQEKAIIFTHSVETLRLYERFLKTKFPQDSIYVFHGQHARYPLTPKARSNNFNQFKAHRGPAVILMSLLAGGTGLNIQEANHVYHLDRWYNPAKEKQATDRAHRRGQERPVWVTRFEGEKSIENRIARIIEQKGALQGVIETGSKHLKKGENILSGFMQKLENMLDDLES